MWKLNKMISAGVLGLAIAGGSYAFLGSPLAPAASAHLRDHPKLQHAYEALRDAEDYLKAAPHDFHGRREEALHAIHVAIDRISMIAGEEEHHDHRSADGHFAPTPLEEHRRMPLWVIHDKLREARQYLVEAKADFHHHKEEAIEAIREAEHQIERIMEEREG